MPSVEISWDSHAHDHGPFYSCTALTHVDWGDSSVLITYGLFSRCRSIDYYDGILPKGLTSIGDMAFFNCISLTRMIFYEGMELFGQEILRECLALRYVEFPATTRKMSLYRLCWDACRDGIHIVVKAMIPPELSSSDTSDNRTRYFYVPDDSLEAYQATEGWSSQTVKPISELPDGYRAMGTLR
ncbi:MAG: leucine-rich repeat protein [Prevotella sp.]|nr:leucine-rich repeat protein [Prevotella sp.]